MKSVTIPAFAFVFLSVLSVAAAQSDNSSTVDFTRIQSVQIPGDIGSMIGDARINIYDYEYRELGGLVVVNGTVREASGNFVEDPTHKIYVKDSGTLESIFSAQSMLKEFNRQRSVHNIRIEALNFGDQVKLAIGTVIASILSLFIPPE